MGFDFCEDLPWLCRKNSVEKPGKTRIFWFFWWFFGFFLVFHFGHVTSAVRRATIATSGRQLQYLRNDSFFLSFFISFFLSRFFFFYPLVVVTGSFRFCFCLVSPFSAAVFFCWPPRLNKKIKIKTKVHQRKKKTIRRSKMVSPSKRNRRHQRRRISIAYS